MAHKLVRHVGFKAAARSAARGAGVSEERGRAIIAASAAKASPAAKRRNPWLRRVRTAQKTGGKAYKS